MLIDTTNIFEQPSNIIVYKSLEEDKPYWIIIDENNHRNKVDFGSIVLAVLNRINRINDFDEDFINCDILENSVEEWQKHYSAVMEAYSNRKEWSKKKMLRFYKKYQFLGFDVLNYPYLSPKHFLKECRYNTNGEFGLSRDIGCVCKDGIYCEKYTVKDYAALFKMDLYEFLFNLSLNQKVGKCSHCHEYFITDSYKNKRCKICQLNANKINYRKYGKEPIHKLKTDIVCMLTRNKRYAVDSSKLMQNFNTEFNYYNDMINKGISPIPKLREYGDIKTKEELIDWLERKKNSLRTYKKDDKTN